MIGTTLCRGLKAQAQHLCATQDKESAENCAGSGVCWLNQFKRHCCMSVLQVMNLPSVFRKPVRITITLPHNIYQHLKSRSDDEGRSLSNLAAYLIEKSLD
ncbi:MAG: hypothetical protein VKO26_01635 [Cyanobacteriota bacterium]|nr:hypothetical protein [Cyanobacteriota bacterium]